MKIQIGDQWRRDREIFEVVDIYEIKSLATQKTIGYQFITRRLVPLVGMPFQTTATTIIAHRIAKTI